MTPIAVMDLSPYRHYIHRVYMDGCLRMLSPFDDFTVLCIDIFIDEINTPRSSEIIVDDHLSRGPITDLQYQVAKTNITLVVNLIDRLLVSIVTAIDSRLCCIKYDYNATAMTLTLYTDNR